MSDPPGQISGRIGGLTSGYDLRATWDGQGLRGRIGGRFQGMDLDLTWQGRDVGGRVGGSSLGFDVVGEVTPERVGCAWAGGWTVTTWP